MCSKLAGWNTELVDRSRRMIDREERDGYVEGEERDEVEEERIEWGGALRMAVHLLYDPLSVTASSTASSVCDQVYGSPDCVCRPVRGAVASSPPAPAPGEASMVTWFVWTPCA